MKKQTKEKWGKPSTEEKNRKIAQKKLGQGGYPNFE